MMVEGMVKRGYARDFAERCFNQIKGFGEYGFPESHAAFRASWSTSPPGSNTTIPAVFLRAAQRPTDGVLRARADRARCARAWRGGAPAGRQSF
jgi:error-prone DNA polymerase